MLQNIYMVMLIIFVVNIIYVTLSTVRMILTLKGRRYIAATVSLAEVVVYVIGLGLVLDNLNAIQNVAAYALGYGIGVIVGSKIEEKLALGYITVNVISSDPELDFSNQLRAKGYGVTSWLADGRDGHRLSLQILTPRKYELKLYQDIKEVDPRAFIIAYEPKQIYGGFWVKQVKKGRLFNHRKHPVGEVGQGMPMPGHPEAGPAPYPHPEAAPEEPLETRTNDLADHVEIEPKRVPPRARVQTKQNPERQTTEHKPEPGQSPGPGSAIKEKKNPDSDE